MKKVTKDSIENYLKKLHDKGYTSLQIEKKVEHIKSFLLWAQVNKKIDSTDAEMLWEQQATVKPPLDSTMMPIPSNSFATRSIFEPDVQTSATIPIPKPAYLVGGVMAIIIMLLLGVGLYKNIFQKASPILAYPSSPVVASRIISFQGRLTDSLGNPITTATNMRFRLYTLSSGGSTLYDSGTCSITPDQDGIHNVLVGSSCGSEIASTVFSENANVYLGVTVGSDSEMTPRQQIANVGYAINSETLQGLPLGTTASTVPYINRDGNVMIGTSAPGIRNTYASATFTVSSANALTLQAAGAGDVTLTATESGTIKFLTGGTQAGVITNGQLFGLGTTGPDAKLDSLATSGEQLRLTYTDGSVYTSFTTNSGGDLTLAPSGSDTNITGNTDISGSLTAATGDAFAVDTSGNTSLDNQADLRLLEADGNGSNYAGFQAPSSLAGDTLYTLPTAFPGGASGYFLTSDTSGTTSWTNAISASSLKWNAITAPDGNLSLTHAAYSTTMGWTATGALDAWTNNFNNNGGSSTTQDAMVINNAAVGSFTDTATENLLLLQQLDTTTSGTTAVTNALKVDAAASSGITNGITVTNSAGNVTTGINIADTAGGTLATGIALSGTFTTGIDAGNAIIANIGNSATDFDTNGGLTLAGNLVVQGTTGLTFNTGAGGDITFANGEKIDNDTDGTILLTGALAVTSTSDLRGNIANSTGNLVLADTIDLGSATTGLNITTAGLITDTDGNIVLGDAVDIGSATTGINITTAGLITDSDGNVVIGDAVDLGSASTGINVTTGGTISDSDGNVAINDSVDVTGGIDASTTLKAGTSDAFSVDTSGNTLLDNQADLRLLEADANGSNYAGFQAPATLAGDTLYTLPTAFPGGASGYFLTSDTSGTLSWTNSLTASALKWNALTAPDGALSLAMADYASTFTWDTPATSTAKDGMTFAWTNDAGTDATTQRLMVLANNDDGGSTGTTERLLVLDNKDTNEAVTTGLEILASSTGTVTTAIDVSDAEIGTALSTGANDLSGTNWSLTGSTGMFAPTYLVDFTNNAYGIDPAGTGNFGGYSEKITGGALLAYDSGSVGIGTGGPDRKLDVLDASGPQIRLTYTDGSVYTDLQTDSSGNLTIDATGTKSIVADDLQVTGNDILDSGAISRINLGATTTLTNTTTTLSGTTTLTASSLATLTTAATLGMASTTTLNCGNCINFDDFADSPTLDATMALSQGTNTWTNTFTGTSGTGYALAAASLTTGEALDITSTSAPSDGSTNEAIDLNITHTPTSLADNFQSINLATTDGTALANTVYGIYNSLALSGNAAKNGYGIYSTVSSSSTTADTTAALDLATSITGIISTGTRAIYGLRSQPAVAAANTGGTTNLYGAYLNPSATTSTTGSTVNVYGEYITSTGTLTTDGTLNQYGLYIANGTSSTTGTATKTGLYVESPTGADTNYAAIFAGGNVGVGTTGPDAKIDSLATSGEQLRLTYTDGSVYSSFTTDSSGYLTIAPTGVKTNITGSLFTSAGTTFGDASGDTVTSNADAWTFANDTAITLSGGKNGINFDSNTLSIDAQNDRVAVGSDTPLAKLDVQGSADIVQLSVKNNGTQTSNPIELVNSSGTTISAIDASGRHLANIGTATNAGYGFYGDANTGMYEIAADTIGFATNGTAQLGIGSNGDISRLAGNGQNALPDQGSIAPNSSFEVDVDGDTYPDGWAESTTGASAFQTTGGVHGDKYMRVNALSTFYVMSTCFPITGGKIYQIYAMVQAQGAPGNQAGMFTPKIRKYSSRSNCESDSSGTDDNAAASQAGNTGWTEVNTTITTTASNYWGRLKLINSNATYGMNVDAVRLTRSAFGSSLDLAETYPVAHQEDVMPGDLVAMGSEKQPGADISNINKTTTLYDDKLFGVVSTQPGYVLDDEKQIPKAQIALKGRVPTHVSSENGAIAIGDPITASSIPGVGMKSDKPGKIVGYALESYDNSDANNVGSIIVFVNPEMYNKPLTAQEVDNLKQTGSLTMSPDRTTTYNGTTGQEPEQSYMIKIGDSIIEQASILKSAIIANLTAGLINVQLLIAETVHATNATIANITTNDLQARTIAAARITSQKLEVNSLSARDVTSTSLASEMITSKKVRADELSGATIEEIQNRLLQVASQQNISASTSGELDKTIAQVTSNVNTIQKSLNDLKDAKVADASYYQPAEGTSFENLTISNNANLYNLFVLGAASVDDVYIQNNTLSSLSDTLALNALAQIDLMDGAVVIARNGDITSRGQLIALGGIRTNSIKAVNPGQEITVQLESGIDTTTGNHHDGSLNVTDNQGTKVAQISNKGDARFNTLSLDTAPSSSAIIAASESARLTGVLAPGIETNNTAAGAGMVPAQESQILIYNDTITSKSLMYITPTSNTYNKSLFVSGKQDCTVSDGKPCKKYFKISIDQPLPTDTQFNWWIIN